MTTTRRLSGLQGASHQQTSLMLDSYEAFKRKHLAQNKEIIQKNSELHKANADLQRQISLMRAERLSLKGTQFQLECENAALRDKLDRCEERERRLIDERDRLKRKGAGVLDDGQVEAMQRLLAQTIAHLQAFGLMLPSSTSLAASPAHSNASFVPPESPLASTSAAVTTKPAGQLEDDDTTAYPATATTRRRSLAVARAARPSMTAPPDLSNITEGEGSAEEEDSADQLRRSLDWRGPLLAQMASAAPAALPAVPSRREPSTTPPPSPPRAAPSTSASTSASVPSTNPTRPPPRAPRAPPKAPSSTSHEALSESLVADAAEGKQSRKRRSERRVSGMVRPQMGVLEGQEDEGFDMREEKEDEADQRQEDVGEDEDEWIPPARPSAAAKGKRRASTIGLEPTVAEVSIASSRATRGRMASVSPAPEEVHLVDVQPVPSNTRPALKEIQSPPPPASLSTSASAPKPVKRPVVEQLQPRPPRKTPTAAPGPARSDAEHIKEEDGRGAALLKARKDAVRSQRAKQTLEQRAQPEDQVPEVGEEVDEDRSDSMAEETMSGPRSKKAPKKVDELEVLSEEGFNSLPNEHGDEPAAGRRARKSVNYALPKLNTKMRRPADYVPVTKPSTANKPRKSNKSGGLASSATASAPPSTASTEHDVDDAPTPRTASLAGKRPASANAISTSEESDAEEVVVPSRHSRALDASTTSSEDEWNEQQFLRRSSIVPTSSSRSQAGQVLDERRRQRQAQKEQLFKSSGSGSVGGRRHSVAV